MDDTAQRIKNVAEKAAEKDTNDYVEHFDPEWYMSTYWGSSDSSEKNWSFGKFSLDTAHEFLSTEVRVGERLLDVGTGPSIHSVLSASRLVRVINLSDFTPRNLEVLRDWRDGGRSLGKKALIYEMNLASDRGTEKEREAGLRAKVKGIYRIDVSNKDVFLDDKPSVLPYDIITSSFCLEAVSPSKEVFASSVKNISGLLKSGGLLLIFGVLGETFYRVDNFRFLCAKLTANEIRTIFEENKYTVLKYKTMFGDREQMHEENDLGDFEDVFVMLAQKQ